MILIFLLQLNSTIHYGLIYRLKLHNPLLSPVTQVSNMFILWSQTFIGIIPHPLYLHDHFQGYDHILAITYIDAQGKEQWLPFINEEGRNIIWMFLYVAPLCFSLVLLAIFVSFLNNQFNHFYPREFPSIKNLIKTKCHFSFTRLQSPHIEQKSVNQQPKLGKTEQFFRVAMICYF